MSLLPAELTLPAILLYAAIAAALAYVVHRYRDRLLRGVPDLSATALGLFRIALGLALFRAMHHYLELPDEPPPGGNEDERGLWAPWGFVEYLGEHWRERDALQTLTLVAIAAFTAGLATRLAYVVVVLGFVVRLLVGQEYGVGSHAWVLLPIVLASMLVVPWGDGLSVDNVLRRRLGRPRQARPPGPHYGMAVWLPGLVLGTAWLAAAFAKLKISGLEWITSGAVRFHWVEDHFNANVSWGTWISGHEWLAILLSAGGVAIEMLFITHVFFRSWQVRLAAGVVGMSLLLGFYLFQGVFWFGWWLVLLAFVPWEPLARGLERLRAGVGGRGGAGAAAEPVATKGRRSRLAALSPAVAVVAALVLVQQLAISRADVEQMPFFSDYPMYSGTHESPEAFNRTVSPVKFYRYEILDTTGDGRPRDITAPAEETDLHGALLEIVYGVVRTPGEPLDPSLAEDLVAARADFEEETGRDVESVLVVAHRREFDFDEGEFVERTPPLRIPIELDGSLPSA